MQTVLPSEFKRMMVLMLAGGPHVLEDFHVTGTAQTRHKLHTRLRHLTNNRVMERVFADNERVAVAQLETRRSRTSYSKDGTHVFLDAETYDELDISDEQPGERRGFLKENEEYKSESSCALTPCP
jgi:elongation factor P